MVSDERQWAARAAAAESAAEKLESALDGIQRILGSNYFGDGCVEGQAFYDGLSAALEGWSGAVRTQATSLRTIAGDCLGASMTYQSADRDAADGIAT